ncbi:MAG: DNA gyrase subunit A [SAR202 cluster bacterium]|nr:DNA gyrase subunit A [SAR202 cluster bacterium]
MVTASDRPLPQTVRIDDEMRSSYLSYAMSVIVARALPDIRDGLKPVQRRILYAMSELNLGPNSAYKKCARIVGEVLGKYHPHGDAPVYDALVRMAQDFSLRYPLVDGQGNFGSIDDDPPAAMRYTEARLTRVAMEMLADIDLDTVDFTANFDDSLKEPTVLPARLPNLLVNGASGIAVGMATSIPPHNLGEICDAVVHLIDQPDTYVEDLLQYVKGPDFPTGAIALVGKGNEFGRQLYSTGRGRVVMQAKTDIEEIRGGRSQIVVTEIPYQVNKASLVARIAQLVRDKKIDGISDIRDESDRQGLRIVIELKRDAHDQIVLNNLFKHTALQSAFNVTMLALVDGQPQILNLKDALQQFIQHRQRVVTRRSEFLLKKAKDRAHILEGLRKALENLDLVIKLIREAKDVQAAKDALMQRLTLTDIQAQAILDMQLRRLAALERQKLEEEYQEVLKTIAELEAILASPAKVLEVIRGETLKLKDDFKSPRMTKILKGEPGEKTFEELYKPEDVVLAVSRRGYVKVMPLSTYRAQHRGGRGVRGMSTREDDIVQHIVATNTYHYLLFFTNRGRVYRLRCAEIHADTSRNTRGSHVKNLIGAIADDERISAIISLPEVETEGKCVVATRIGEVKAVRFENMANIRSNGLIFMDLEPGDEVVSVRKVEQDEDVHIITAKGQSIRFPGEKVPVRSRAAGGVRGIRRGSDDYVVGMETVKPNERLLVVSANGYGKLVALDRFRQQGRGGKGVRVFKVTDKTGPVAAARVVAEGVEDEVMLSSAQSQVIRTSLASISQQGRNASGVRVWKAEDGDKVVAITCFQNGKEKGE